MSGLALGPLFLPTDRLALVVILFVVMGAGAVFEQRLDPRFARWSLAAVVAGLILGRAADVAADPAGFVAAPWRVFAVWDGGLSWRWALLGAAAATPLTLRKPRLVPWGFGAVALAAAAAWAVTLAFPPPPPKPLPQLTVSTMEARPIHPAALDGRPTVINLWATWCPPCRRELPDLIHTAQAQPQVRFILADQGEDTAKVRQVLARQGLSSAPVALDPAQRLSAYFATPGLPATFVFDRQGRLVFSRLGALAPQDLRGAIARASR